MAIDTTRDTDFAIFPELLEADRLVAEALGREPRGEDGLREILRANRRMLDEKHAQGIRFIEPEQDPDDPWEQRRRARLMMRWLPTPAEQRMLERVR